MNTASTGRYGPVLSLIGTQNARYQAKKREKKRENLESSAALLICCPRSISSPRAGRRNVSPCGEKERGDNHPPYLSCMGLVAYIPKFQTSGSLCIQYLS
ncbi:hypothetical protein GW17_00024433 [Ensete ventricosum]|nr:hypothetical protein GW17_00024433 [Ensete ventricosum]